MSIITWLIAAKRQVIAHNILPIQNIGKRTMNNDQSTTIRPALPEFLNLVIMFAICFKIYLPCALHFIGEKPPDGLLIIKSLYWRLFANELTVVRNLELDNLQLLEGIICT